MFFAQKGSNNASFIIFVLAKQAGPIVQWIECKIPVLMIWVRIPVGSQKAAIYAAFVVIGERKAEHQTLNTTTSPRYCLTPVVRQVLHSANSGIFPTA